MKFQLVEDLFSESGKQSQNNRKIRETIFGKLKASEWVTHHLNDTKLETGLKIDDLDNVIFLKRTPSGDTNAAHQFVTAAANIGGVDNLMKFLQDPEIGAIATILNGNVELKSLTIKEAVELTIHGRNREDLNSRKGQREDSAQISIFDEDK